MPRQRKHLPRNHSRKKIPALWTASKRQSGRTLLAMCGTCSACCAPVWGRGFRVSKLNVIWTITGETAAETAILYGQTLTTLNTILAIAQDHIKIQADQLWLEADYTGSAKQQRVVSLKLLLCPLLALITVVCFVWHARHDPQLLPPKHPEYNTPETEQGGNL